MAPTRQEDETPRAAALKGRAIGGAAVTGLAQAVKVALQFVSVVVLARLLSPSDFGIFAMVMPLTAFVMVFQDLGLTQAVISAREITRGQMSGLFWINLGVSILLAVVLAACAPLLGLFYAEPKVVGLTIALAATIIIAGLGAQHFALLTRDMRFKPLALIDIASNAGGLAVAILIGWWRPSVWALFSATLAQMLIGLAGAWLSSGWRPGRPAPFSEVRAMLRLGGGVTTFNISNFFARNLDNVLIGHISGAAQLGLYDRAYKLLLLPLQQINNPIGRVMVPVLSRLAGEPERYRHAYARTAQQILLVTVPGVLFLIFTADVLIPTLMGKQWAAAAPIFAWLGVAALHQPFSSTAGWLFISQQRTGQFARWGLFNAVTCVAAFVAGLPWGAVGVAAAYALSDVFIRLPALWWYVGREGPVRTKQIWAIATPFLAAGAASAAVLAGLRQVTSGHPFLDLGIAAAAAYLAAGAGLLLSASGRGVLKESLDLVAMAGHRLGVWRPA
ncbi:MAG: polysaccharide biosynthesis protein [Caulobacter sp.]|nr:polysaccharide biosynthesis protein [Caulobacter sp.]